MDAWFSDDEEELADLGELDNSRSLPSLQVSGLRIPPTLGPQRHEPDSTLHRPSPPTPLLQDLLSASESQERGAREFTFPVIRDDVSESDSDTGPAAPVFSSIDYAADTNPDGSSRLSTSRASTRGGASPLKVTFDAALDLDAHMSQSPMRVATPGVKTTNPNPSTHRAVSYHPPTATTTTTAATTSDSGSVYVPGPALDADGLAPSRAVIDEPLFLPMHIFFLHFPFRHSTTSISSLSELRRHDAYRLGGGHHGLRARSPRGAGRLVPPRLACLGPWRRDRVRGTG